MDVSPSSQATGCTIYVQIQARYKGIGCPPYQGGPSLDPQIWEGLPALVVVGAQGEVDRPFRHEHASPMPTVMPLPCYFYIRMAAGRNALFQDNAEARSDVKRGVTQHCKRFTFEQRHSKHQPRCSTQIHTPQCAAGYRWARIALRRAWARAARRAVAYTDCQCRRPAHRPRRLPPRDRERIITTRQLTTADTGGSLKFQAQHSVVSLSLSLVALMPPVPGPPFVQATHD